MKLAPHEILRHLGFAIPAEGVDLCGPDNAIIAVEVLHTAGRAIQQLSDEQLIAEFGEARAALWRRTVLNTLAADFKFQSCPDGRGHQARLDNNLGIGRPTLTKKLDELSHDERLAIAHADGEDLVALERRHDVTQGDIIDEMIETTCWGECARLRPYVGNHGTAAERRSALLIAIANNE